MWACRGRLSEESRVALWIRSRRLYDKAEVDQGLALAQVSSLVYLLGRTGSTFKIL